MTVMNSSVKDQLGDSIELGHISGVFLLSSLESLRELSRPFSLRVLSRICKVLSSRAALSIDQS